MKRLLSVIALVVALIIVCPVALPCLAEETYVAGAPFVQDWAYVIEDPARAEAMAKAAYEKTGYAFCFGSVVENTEEEKLYNYAARFFSAYFPYENGLMLFIDKTNNTYVIYRAGTFDTWMDQEKFNALCAAYKSKDNPEQGFEAFIDEAYLLATGETLVWETPEAIPELVSAGETLETVPDVTPDPVTGLIPRERTNALVTDTAGLLSASDTASLNAVAEKMSETYGVEVAILIVPTVNGQDITRYADDAYDYLGYGAGEGDDGLLLVIAAQDREYSMSGYGAGKQAFTDYGMLMLEDALVNKLRNNDWVGGCYAFYETADPLLAAWQSGNPIGWTDPDPTMKPIPAAPTPTPAPSFMYNPKGLAPFWYVFALVGGFLLAFIPVSKMKNKVIESVKANRDAAQYEKENAFGVYAHEDTLINTSVSRMPKPQQPTYTGGGGGGGGASRGGGGGYTPPRRSTSTHVSSSGRSHSGTRGRF